MRCFSHSRCLGYLLAVSLGLGESGCLGPGSHMYHWAHRLVVSKGDWSESQDCALRLCG